MAIRRTRASIAAARELQQLSSPPTTQASPAQRGNQRQKQVPPPKGVKKEATKLSSTLRRSGNPRKRTRASESSEQILEQLPHNLGTIATQDAGDATTKHKDEHIPPAKKRARGPPKDVNVKVDPEVAQDLDEKAMLATPADVEMPGIAKGKKNKYGFMPGQTPYPDWPSPTPEQCYEVDRALSKVHGKVKAPDTIPVPSVTVAGCGEVPSVLDALIRTRLSAATTNTNSSRAFQGLVKTFGTIKEGIGKGSVDWNAVRIASQEDVFEAIKIGGLAQVKSKDIKAILEMTYKENQARKAALKQNVKDAPAGVENESAAEKEAEIAQAESDVLSLDHYHSMETQEAIDRMVEFPGIGVKTAACVALFCLRRSCFAVDTHVFRLCQYLGWVPPPESVKPGQPKVSRNTVYSHCEARVPDELKYSLHQLLIKHGKLCPRCRAATTTSSAEWAKGCPIEHLVYRFEPKKGGSGAATGPTTKRTPSKAAGKTTSSKTKKGPKRSKPIDEDESEEAESSALSDLESAEEEHEQPTTKRTPARRAARNATVNKVADWQDGLEDATDEESEEESEAESSESSFRRRSWAQ